MDPTIGLKYPKTGRKLLYLASPLEDSVQTTPVALTGLTLEVISKCCQAKVPWALSLQQMCGAHWIHRARLLTSDDCVAR